MPKQLTLLIDIVSPFAYLAFHLVRESPVFKDVHVRYVPILLGGIMKATGNSPPINIKNKRTWIAKERIRWSSLFDIPIAKDMPPGFPWNTVQVQRALVATSLAKPERLADTIAELYRLTWVESQPVYTFDQIRPVFLKLFGDSVARQILEEATSETIKKALTDNTQAALEAGCFGLPWFKATNERGEEDHFWGFDHIGQVTAFLDIETPAKNATSGWRAML